MSSFLWVRCPEAATWQRVKEMAKRHPHKWDMEADGTLIAALFTAVEVLPHCYIEVRNYVCFTFHSTVGHKQTSPERSSWSVSVVLNKHSDRKYSGWFLGQILNPSHIRYFLGITLAEKHKLNTFALWVLSESKNKNESESKWKKSHPT